jgi:transcriptional regulator with XRE-family HTH domain
MTQPTPWLWLQRQRERAGYRQTRLAAAVGVSVSHLNKIEAGTRGLSPELRKRISEVLALDIDEMIDTAPTPPSQAVASSSPVREPDAVAS